MENLKTQTEGEKPWREGCMHVSAGNVQAPLSPEGVYEEETREECPGSVSRTCEVSTETRHLILHV